MSDLTGDVKLFLEEDQLDEDFLHHGDYGCVAFMANGRGILDDAIDRDARMLRRS